MDDRSAGPPRRLVNVNTASFESLRDDVLGIGPVLAERIVAYREANGPFATVADLVQVDGIGPLSLARFADQLTVSEDEITATLTSVEATPVVEPENIERVGPSLAQRLIADPVMTLTGEEMALRPDEPEPEYAELEVQSIEAERRREDVELAELPVGQAIEEAEAPTSAPESIKEQHLMQEEPEIRAEPQPIAPPPAAGPAPAAAPAAKPSFWRSFWLVALGGLLGVLLTLLVMLIVSGTLDFASRREVDALSRNMNTMQANNELAWQRIEDLTVRAERAERQLARVDELAAQLQTVEADLGATQSDLAEAKLALNKAAKDLESLQVAMDKALAEVDERLDQTEANVKRLSATVAELEMDVAKLDERVQRFDAFFSALRDLLIDLEGAPPAPIAEPEVGSEPAAPTPSPTDTPLPTPTPLPTITVAPKG